MQRQYKNNLSGVNSWVQKQHAKEWLLFPDNIRIHLSLDETTCSKGDLYTILTNKKSKGKKGAILAMVKFTKANVVIKVLTKLPLNKNLKFKQSP